MGKLGKATEFSVVNDVKGWTKKIEKCLIVNINQNIHKRDLLSLFHIMLCQWYAMQRLYLVLNSAVVIIYIERISSSYMFVI